MRHHICCSPAAAVVQVPMLRASLLRRRDWEELAERAKREQFGAASQQLSKQRIESMLKAFDLMSSLEEGEGGLQVGQGVVMWGAGSAIERMTAGQERASPVPAPMLSSCHLAHMHCPCCGTAPACSCLQIAHLPPFPPPSHLQAARGVPSSFTLQAYRSVKEGVWEWWATYNLDINTDKPAEPVSVPALAAAAAAQRGGAGSTTGAAGDENQPRQPSQAGMEGGGEKGAGGVVKGQRYRLRPLAENLQRALPSSGKLAVVVGGRTCQASLELPASETRWAGRVGWGWGGGCVEVAYRRPRSIQHSGAWKQAP